MIAIVKLTDVFGGNVAEFINRFKLKDQSPPSHSMMGKRKFQNQYYNNILISDVMGLARTMQILNPSRVLALMKNINDNALALMLKMVNE